MKRTLMLRNQELLDFEVDLSAKKVRVLDAPSADDPLLSSLGLANCNLNYFLTESIRGRSISAMREDIDEILGAFGAKSILELMFLGHGLSLIDGLWYRAPGSTERWEDINFLDNDWDSTFLETLLTGDYGRLSSCSPDIPELTMTGHLKKAWERSEEGIFMLKEPNRKSGIDLKGAKLAAELASRLYGQDEYQPLHIVSRNGRLFSSSPLMTSHDEELIQGARLFAMGGFSEEEAQGFSAVASTQAYIEIISRAGVSNASASVAKLFAFSVLAVLLDYHPGNYGVIRNLHTGSCRAALPFDYDLSFGFHPEEDTIRVFCNNPALATLFMAKEFSGLDPRWDWSWYNPEALESFEERIAEELSGIDELPPNFGHLVTQAFITQRNYLNEIVSKWENG